MGDTAEGDVRKPKLSRRTLESIGVYFDEDVYSVNDTNRTKNGIYDDTNDLPDGVENLRKVLLDFRGSIPNAKIRQVFTEEHKALSDIAIPPDSALWYVSAGEANSEEWDKIKEQNKTISSDQVLAKEFRDFEMESEAEWVDSFLLHLFRKYEKVRPFNVRQKDEEFFERWHRAQGLPWSEIGNLRSEKKTTAPKPDLTYGFPIHTAKDLRQAELPEGYAGSKDIANLSLDFLKKLRGDGIITSPSAGLFNAVNGKLRDAGLRRDYRMCFPWAVVEVKRDRDKRTIGEKCYYQAANAAAAALELQMPLSEHLFHGAATYLFPVVAFTCIGPDVKTWLAFAEKQRNGTSIRRMVCIWDANMKSTWGVYSMRLIIDNMQAWAQREVRQKVVQHLDYVRKKDYSQVRMKSTLPETPVRPTFLLQEDTRCKTVEIPRGRCDDDDDDRYDRSPVTLLAPPRTARRHRRPKSISAEPRFADLHTSSDGRQARGDSDAEDSGIGGMSDDDIVQSRRASDDIWFRPKVIEKILNHRKKLSRGGVNSMNQYLVKFEGLDDSHNAWEFARAITTTYGCDHLVHEYRRRMRKR